MPAPLYMRVEEALLERIRKDYRPGQLLPTQRELAREFGASLITIKRALAEIARKGHLQSTRGRGTVVLRPVVQDDRAGVSSWTDSMTGLGRAPRTVASSVEVKVPPPDLARALGLKARERAVFLTRRRSLDGDPFCLMHNVLPLALAPDLAQGLPEESLYGWLKARYRLVPDRAEEEVEARAPDRVEAEFLGRAAKIVLFVRRRTYLADGRVLEMSDIAASADRYRYRVEITRR
jgi:DNA-binding GntR family transcriptional regulator